MSRRPFTERNTRIVELFTRHRRGLDDIAAQFGMTKDAVRGVLTRAGHIVVDRKPRDHARDAACARLYRNGLGVTVIGKRLGLHRNEVRNALARQNVTLRPRGWLPRNGPARIGPYPLKLEPPKDKVFCGQCETLVPIRRAEACPSRFCKARQA